MNIEVGKKYVMSNGAVFRCVCNNRKGKFPVMFLHDTGTFEVLYDSDEEGTYPAMNAPITAVREVKPWDEFEIDEPVIASNGAKGYFAGVSSGGDPRVFLHGATSWSSSENTVTFRSVRRPTQEELNGEQK